LFNKKGEITTFVILGVIIVASIGGLYYQGYVFPSEEDKSLLENQVEPFRNFVGECVSQVAQLGLEEIGEHGGYYSYEGMKVIDFSGDKVVVALKLDGKMINRMVSESMVEEQFDLFMESRGNGLLKDCVKSVKGLGVSLKKGEIKADVRDDVVVLRVDWPMNVRKGRARVEVDQKDVQVLIPMGKVLKVANDIVNLEVEGKLFEGTTLDRYMRENDLFLRGLRIEGVHYPSASQEVFLIKSVPTRVGEEEFRFYFAVDRE